MNHHRCWAAPIGDCGGKITKEHLFTNSLFRGQVELIAENIKRSDSTPAWLKSGKIDIASHKLHANILCETHNRILGRGPDRTAKQLMKALVQTSKPMKLPGSKICRRPVLKKISGVAFGQWLCKIHCNMLAATGLAPDSDFVFYAFGKNTRKRIFFYFRTEVGCELKIRRGHVQYIQFVEKVDPTVNIFQITLSGIEVLVSTIPVDNIMIGNQEIAKMEWMDRLRVIQQPTDLGMYKIILDWSNEPLCRDGT